MKKYILLLLIISGFMQAQTLQNPTFGNTTTNTLKVKTLSTVTSVSFLPTIEADFSFAKIDPVLLPLSTATINAINTAGNSYVKKTGDNFNYSIDFDDLISQDVGLNIKKRTLKPESTRLTSAVSTIYGWGDSLTSADFSTYSYLYHLNVLTGFTMVNKGVGGEVSTSIKNRFIADVADYDKTVIIWAGRNNFMSPATVKADIATMVSALTHTRYLVLGIINGDFADEYINTTKWQTINTLNADLKAIYGKKFLDIRPYLVNLNDNSAQSIIDRANDVYPYFLRSDQLHPNAAGALKIAEYINRYLGVLYEKEEYFQSKDFLYYYNLYDNNLHKSLDETFTGKKTTTNTTTPFSNGLILNSNGGASSKVAEINVGGAGGAKGIDIILTSNGYGTYATNTGGGQVHRVDNPSNGQAFVVQNTGNSGYGLQITNSGGNTATQGIRIDNAVASVRGYWGINRSTGVLNENFNISTGLLNMWDSGTSSTGDILRVTKNSTTRTKIDSEANLFFVSAPQVSPATFDILVRSSVAGSTLGRVETIPSTTFAPTANPAFTGNGSIGNNWTVGGALTMPAGNISFTGNSLGFGSFPQIGRVSGHLAFSGSILNAFYVETNTDNLTAIITRTIANVSGEETVSLSGSAVLDFPSTLAGTSSELTITVAGAVDGDVIALGVPNVSSNANSCFTARVSAANTVTVKFNNYSALPIDPASGVFKGKVIK